MDLGHLVSCGYPQVSHTHRILKWMVHWWVPKGNEGSQIRKENCVCSFLELPYWEKGCVHDWKVKFIALIS
jgi:hypothetical protein